MYNITLQTEEKVEQRIPHSWNNSKFKYLNRIKRWNRYPQTHKYMNTHLLGLVQALQYKKSGGVKQVLWSQNLPS
jgi:hypothetical protein